MTELSDVCLIIVDCEHKTAPKADDGYPLVRTSDIGRGRLDLSNVQRVDAGAYERWTRRAVPQPGDLILAREAPVGNVAIVTAGLEPVLGQRTVLIRPDPDQIDPDYLTYRLLAYDLQHWMNGVANGSTVPHLNMEDIRALPMPPLPTLDEQRRVGAALAAIDDLIENNRRRIEVLEEMARLIYREWFVHFRYPGHEDVQLVDSELGPIPDGWTTARLEDCCMFQSGKTISKDDRDGGSVPVYGANGMIGRTSLDPNAPACTVMGKIGSCGALHRSAADCWVTNNAFAVLPGAWTHPLLVWLGLREIDFAPLIGGAANPYLPLENFGHLLQVVPAEGVVQRFVQAVGPMFGLIDCLSLQNRVLTDGRDLLLPRLISGEVAVSELDLDLDSVG